MTQGLDAASEGEDEVSQAVAARAKQAREAVLELVGRAIEGSDATDDTVQQAAKVTGGVLKGAARTTQRMATAAVSNVAQVLSSRVAAASTGNGGSGSVDPGSELDETAAIGMQDSVAQRVLAVLATVANTETEAKVLVRAGGASEDVQALAGEGDSLPSTGGIVEAAMLLSRASLLGAIPGETPVVLRDGGQEEVSVANNGNETLALESGAVSTRGYGKGSLLLISGRMQLGAYSTVNLGADGRRLQGSGDDGGGVSGSAIGLPITDSSAQSSVAAQSAQRLAQYCLGESEGASAVDVDSWNATTAGFVLVYPNISRRTDGSGNRADVLDASVLEWDSAPHSLGTASVELSAGDAQSALIDAIARQSDQGTSYDTTTTTTAETIPGWSCTAVSANLFSSSDGTLLDLPSIGAEACIIVPRDLSEPAQPLDGPIVLLPGNSNDSASSAYADEAASLSDASTGLPVASCMYWSDAANQWQGDGCRAVAVTATSIVCRCTHLTDFSGRFELLLSENKAILRRGGSITAQDLVRNLRTAITLACITGVVLVAGVVTLQLDVAQHREFTYNLLQDPEVAFMRGLIRIEGCNETLRELVERKEGGQVAKLLGESSESMTADAAAAGAGLSAGVAAVDTSGWYGSLTASLTCLAPAAPLVFPGQVPPGQTTERDS